MKATSILVAALLLITAGLTFNQWRLQRAMKVSASARPSNAPTEAADSSAAAAQLREAKQQLNEAQAQLETADRNLTRAATRIAQLDQRLRRLEGRGKMPTAVGEVTPPLETSALEGDVTNTLKRAWGPEQATGEPDTMQAGDIATAWAPLEQNGGQEWLKLDYEAAVDIAEVRVRETHNPGAIYKLTALLADGTEVTLWEGTEPASQAPVEMSFSAPPGVAARSVKVYLDTQRAPGWNEIDAVELIGRDGSHQWARHASASSTFAQPRPNHPTLRLEQLRESAY